MFVIRIIDSGFGLALPVDVGMEFVSNYNKLVSKRVL